MTKILSYNEAKDIASSRYDNNKIAWEHYLEQNIDTMVIWINKRIINAVENDVHAFQVTFDHTFLMDVFKDKAPEMPGGILKIVEKIKEIVNSSEDWNLRIVKNYTAEKDVVWTIISKIPEPAPKKEKFNWRSLNRKWLLKLF